MAVILGLRRDMMMLQQNSNRNDRYLRWMRQSGESTRVSRLVAMAAALISLIRFMPDALSLCIMLVVGVANFAALFTAKYKKPLVMTRRAMRILSTAVTLLMICFCLVFVAGYGRVTFVWLYPSVLFTAAFAVSYWLILAANFLLRPVERRINRGYYDEAASILASMPDLKVVGITGSYGKTSTKHYLHRILSEQYDTVMTPGNFNTTLGVIRTVRENLKPYNEVFIVEMGAKQRGDIKEICDLVHPSMGIITAVGPQHLESFGSIEAVQATKFELADALPPSGLAVVNDDFEYIANRPVSNVPVARYAVDNVGNADFTASDIRYTPRGTYFCVNGKDGSRLELFTRLVGKCNVSNLMAAVIMALHLGVDPDKIRYAVEKIDQVEHRLSIKSTPSGITIIDDAYNSNPVGSEMAMEVLAGLTSGKRIVITPGMIELGDDQYRLNRELGVHIGNSADVAIVVGEYNREAIAEGIRSTAMPESAVHFFPTFAKAQAFMLSIATAGDTVLYENDLPDTFK